MSKLVEATIHSVEKRKSKAGKAAIQVICKHQDGSQWGENIYDWIWEDNDYAHVWTRWGHLIKPNCNADTAKEMLIGDCWDLIGLEVEVEAQETDFNTKRVKNVYLKGQAPDEIDDDIPF